MSLSRQKPAGEWQLPPLQSKYPLFTLVPLGDCEMLMVLDKTGGEDKFYNRAYVDANRNRDLTDDKPLGPNPDLVGRLGSLYTQFAPYDLEILVKGKPVPYRFRMATHNLNRVNRAKGPAAKVDPLAMAAKTTAVLMCDCAAAGTFQLGNTIYRIMLADTNSDGLFGSPAGPDRIDPVTKRRIKSRPDMAYITPNKTIKSTDQVAIGGPVFLGEKLYRIKVDPAGSSLQVEPFTGPTGILTLPFRVKKILLADEKGAQMTLIQPALKVALPAGKYRLVSYQREGKDDGGNLWTLMARGNKSLPLVRVNPAGPVAISFGGPYTPTITARVKDEKTLNLSFKVLGSAGEQVSSLRSTTYQESSIARSTKRKYQPKEAHWEIVNDSGELMGSGDFKYG